MNEIYVKYLGVFEIRKDGKPLIQIKSAKNRVKKLLGLLMLSKEVQYTDEELVSKIWQNETIPSPESALTNLVYLTRKTLKDLDADMEFIIRQNGKYIWNPKIQYGSDLKDIEAIKNKINNKSIEFESLLEYGRKAVELYDGEIAANFEYAAWWLPINEYYNKMFLEICIKICDALEEQKEEKYWEEIIDIATKASKFDLGNDKFYVYIFKSLKHLNRRQTIVNYYENLNKFYSSKMGESLSDEIKKIYAWAIRSEELTFSDISELTESLRERSKDRVIRGAYYCEKEMFKNLVHFILRNSMRNNKDVVVMLITISEEEQRMTMHQWERAMDKIEEVIRKSLRKDDVFSRYSVNQFLIMPFECLRNKINVIEDRMVKNFEELNEDSNLSIDIINFTMEEEGYQLLY